MQTVARMALKEGMEIAEDVTCNTGVIAPKGTKVDAILIQKLARHNIMVVEVMEPEDYATTHNEKVRLSKDFKKFSEVYGYNLTSYKYLVDQFIQNKTPINSSLLMNIHDNIAGCAKSREHLIDMLYNMLPSEDDMTYAHCLNSALIANVFGVWLGLNAEDVNTLTLCGFYYDIGKVKLPNKLLWKPGKLSDFEFNWMKTHTTIGYDLIKELDLDEHIKNCTLQHHERADGSGYPKHLKDEDIDLFAKYIAIVDSYEAMTSARVYRASMHPFQVIANFERTGYEKYGSTIIRPILTHIANDQLGMAVRLSNDMTGTVLLINNDHLSRPLIKCDDSSVMDLNLNRSLEITAIY